MSEGAVQATIAAARAAMTARLPAVDAALVRAALRDVSDPEIPAVSIIDLGIVDEVTVSPDGIEVILLPTFVGCPASR